MPPAPRNATYWYRCHATGNTSDIAPSEGAVSVGATVDFAHSSRAVSSSAIVHGPLPPDCACGRACASEARTASIGCPCASDDEDAHGSRTRGGSGKVGNEAVGAWGSRGGGALIGEDLGFAGASRGRDCSAFDRDRVQALHGSRCTSKGRLTPARSRRGKVQAKHFSPEGGPVRPVRRGRWRCRAS